jgi:hypothetical protein
VPRRGRGAELVLIHIEIEGKARAVMAQRMSRYFMQLVLRHELPVLPVVVYLTGGDPDVQWAEHTEYFLAEEIARFRFLGFGLSGAEAEAYLAKPSPLAAALAALMRPKTLSRPALKVACLNKIGRAKLDAAREFLLVNCVETYLALEEAEAKEYTQLLEGEPAKEAKHMQETWAEKMKAEGRAEGEARGEAKGKAAGKAEAILELLAERQLPVSEAERAAILAQTDLSTLRLWFKRAFSAKTTAELFAPDPPR